MDTIRESAFGQVVRYITRNKVFLYPEEEEGFTWPELDTLLAHEKKEQHHRKTTTPGASDTATSSTENVDGATPDDEGDESAEASMEDIHPAITRNSTRPYTAYRFDAEQEIGLEKTKSVHLAPAKTADGVILVDWYTSDDVANPQNWSYWKKFFIMTILSLYTMAVYGSSSMYVPGIEGVIHEFGVSITAAELGLALYVIGYGIGPLIFAPLSEIAVVGRNWVYLPTFILFVVLGIPTALAQNFAGLMVLRFLTGFFGSPCLANGGASVGDMYTLLELPVYLSAWTAACFWGPVIGPIITGYAVQIKGWRWGLWEIVWLTGPILLVFIFTYPETSADNILIRRAGRLRKLYGRDNIKSKVEVEQHKLKASEVFWDAIIKPIEIMIKDPAVAFTNIYTALTYGAFYSFFESFPLVYPVMYGFNIGQTGLAFATQGVGCTVSVILFIIYQYKIFIPDIKANGLCQPEKRLVPALVGVILLPMGYFMFGWTARPEIHWIVSMIGIVIFVIGNFWVFQSVFIYLPLSYPRYAASLFAANDLFRSLFGAGCVLFARPMYLALGVGPGISLLAGLACVGIAGMFYLWHYGAWLRSRSTFAG